MAGVPLVASALTAPLEVVGVVLAFAGVLAGAAGAAELFLGRGGGEIGDAAAKGGAAGFLIGLVAGAAAALYLLVT